jgi:hypothetical protein
MTRVARVRMGGDGPVPEEGLEPPIGGNGVLNDEKPNEYGGCGRVA